MEQAGMMQDNLKNVRDDDEDHKPSAGISLIGIHLRQYGKVDIDLMEHLQEETRILY
jgi:hypothetical protein